jgi:hypothetical protein
MNELLIDGMFLCCFVSASERPELKEHRVGHLLGVQHHSEKQIYQPSTHDNLLAARELVWSNHTTLKFFGCFPPKCATTHWLTVIRRMALPRTMSERINSLANHELHHYHNFPEYGFFIRGGEGNATLDRRAKDDVPTVANDPAYFKVAVVRHPWKRLVSGFIDKLHVEFQGNFRLFSNKYGFPGQQVDDHTKYFHEFVKALASASHEKVNGHFRPTTDLCQIPQIQYDYIGELDNKKEMDTISLFLGSDKSFSELETAKDYKPYDTPLWCSEETVAYAEEFYRHDLVTFGYHMTLAKELCRTSHNAY